MLQISCTLHFLYSKFLVISTLQKVFIIVDFKIAKKKWRNFSKSVLPPHDILKDPASRSSTIYTGFAQLFSNSAYPLQKNMNAHKATTTLRTKLNISLKCIITIEKLTAAQPVRVFSMFYVSRRHNIKFITPATAPSHESDDSSPCLWNPLTFKPSCFTVYPASQYNFHSTYPAYLIWWTVQIWWSSLLTPPVPSVVLGPNIPSKNTIFCHSNTLYVGIHKGKGALECYSPAFFFGTSCVKSGTETDWLDWLFHGFRLLLQKIRDSAPNKIWKLIPFHYIYITQQYVV